ncbi:ribosome biogenesis GTPase YlqF [Agarivorans gilvus]|uniref:Ribosome biogenesis GTPase A n=1 Tax=Agarivorans gilvus TaxID=680279 RepID=A0ABQ1I5J7_9ALTE|nr:ribosome biogenesis GTPase YlqF [Agarivorans gilvus]GGB12037.1 ribosome biogenesis GTPase A [Agarivorans gilvus]
MAIQWYPGHMHKAQKQIKEVMPKIDLIIEVLDARIPYSSENPMVASLRGDKPCIKVLNKSDLADPDITAAWQLHFEQEQGVKAIPLCTLQGNQTQDLLALCRSMLPNKGGVDKPIHTMICGIPNVGKSTLINALAGRQIAKTGNEPAVTKAQQRIRLEGNIILSDTPGILWPKFDNVASGYRLAATGAVKDTAMDYDDVAAFACEYLLQAYPEALKQRYKLEQLPESEIELMEEIGRRRGCLVRGGQVDYVKAATIILNELRDATIGRISLETPAMVAIEKIETEKLVAEKEEKKKLIAELQKNKKRRRR